MVNASIISVCCPFLLFAHFRNPRLAVLFSTFFTDVAAISNLHLFHPVFKITGPETDLSFRSRLCMMSYLFYRHTIVFLCLCPLLVPLSHDVIVGHIAVRSVLNNLLNLLFSTCIDVQSGISVQRIE